MTYKSNQDQKQEVDWLYSYLHASHWVSFLVKTDSIFYGM